MIPQNQLRIGNWFITDQGTFHQVNDRNIRYTEGMNPIPLRPEILEKCGFTGSRIMMYFKKYVNEEDSENIQLTLHQVGPNPEWNIAYSVKQDYVRLKKRTQYLHELQNLYFCLTGEELPINL